MIRIENPPGTSGGGGTQFNFGPLTVATTGTRTGIWQITRGFPTLLDDGDGTVTGSPSGKWVRAFVWDVQNAIDTVSFTDLAGVTTGFSFLATFPSATSIGYPALAVYPGAFNYGGPYGGTVMTNLVTLDFSGLEVLQGDMDVYGATELPALVTWDLSSLRLVTGYLAPQLPSATSFTWTALEECAFIVIGSCPALTTISTPALVRLTEDSTEGSVYVQAGTDALTTWLCPSTLMEVFAGVKMTGPALDEASVDSWLVRLAALDGTAGTTLFENQIVTITGTSAAPSATGAAAAAVLVLRGCTVTTN